jgi:hypothetical protein
MVPQPRIGPARADRLAPADLADVFAFLDRDPVLNVYLMALVLRDALAAPRDEYWGMRRDGALEGLLHIGPQSGAVLPMGDDPAALRGLAEIARDRLASIPRRFQVIGPRDAVATIVRGLARAGLGPRLERAQVYMALRRGDLPAHDPVPELAPARAEDAPLVHESGAELRREELDEDPRQVDPEGYRRRVEEECRDGHTWVWRDGDGLKFRASVSALTGEAAQVSGVYTPPAWRRRGVARRALGELCARLLDRSAAVCLFVNDFNQPALALYRRLGFRTLAPWASAFYDRAR